MWVLTNHPVLLLRLHKHVILRPGRDVQGGFSTSNATHCLQHPGAKQCSTDINGLQDPPTDFGNFWASPLVLPEDTKALRGTWGKKSVDPLSIL